MFQKIVVTSQNPQSSGSNISPCLSSVVVAAVMVIGNIVTVATIDKIGRRYLLLISTLFISLCSRKVHSKMFFLHPSNLHRYLQSWQGRLG